VAQLCELLRKARELPLGLDTLALQLRTVGGRDLRDAALALLDRRACALDAVLLRGAGRRFRSPCRRL
jgi:hypothetical protein